MSKKYFIYCRKSCFLQNDLSPTKLQEEVLIDYAIKNGLKVAKIYSDTGSDKTDFRKMLKAIRSRKVSCILTTDLRRISRTPWSLVEILNGFDKGIIKEIRTPRFTIKSYDELYFYVWSTKIDRRSMSDRIKRGIAAKKLRNVVKKTSISLIN